MKKKVLLSSILTIALCLCLIAGSTFALFTSESKVNVAVTAGNVDVEATVKNLTLYSPKLIDYSDNTVMDATNAANTAEGTFALKGTAVLADNKVTLSKIVPGDKVEFDIEIENKSDVTIQYRTVIQKVDGTDTDLWKGLKVTIGGDEYDGNIKKTDWTVLNVGEGNDTVHVIVELPLTAGNKYQGKSCEFAYTVEAVQGNVEMPDVWDGVTYEDPKADEDGVYHIKTAAEFAAFINSFTGNEIVPGAGAYRGKYWDKNVVLEHNIDLNGAIIRRDIPSFYYGQFDGQNHIVSNFVLKRVEGDAEEGNVNNMKGYHTALFGAIESADAAIKNLTVKNATVVGNESVGVIVAAVYAGTVENCHVINSNVGGIDQVGAVVGYNAVGTIKDCSATDCNIYYSRTTGANEDSEGTETRGIIGDNDGTATNVTGKNVNVYNNVFSVAATQTELGKAIANGGVIMLLDDIATEEWTSVNAATESVYYPISRTISINGNGHSISGLTQPLLSTHAAQYITFENLTIKGSNIGPCKDNNGGNVGAFVGFVDSQIVSLTLKNCHADNVTVTGNDYGVGALVGYVGGTQLTIEDCSVKNCVVSGGSYNGAIIGFCQTSSNGTLVKNCVVTDNTVKGFYNGQITGMANGDGTLTIENCTYTGNAVGRNAGATVNIID